MKRAAFGIRMHSGWGVLVAVSDEIEIIDRRRIAVTDDKGPRGNQPFHYARELGLAEAEKYLLQYRAESERMARETIAVAAKELKACGYDVAVIALLLASGRPLPELPQILASHPLIHTAEGELFREVVVQASESLRIPVRRYRERAIEQIAESVLIASTQIALQKLAVAGKKLGPPWTSDHKAAVLAGYVALQETISERKAQANT